MTQSAGAKYRGEGPHFPLAYQFNFAYYFSVAGVCPRLNFIQPGGPEGKDMIL